MSAPSSLRLLALHGLRLKGIAEAEVLAATVGVDATSLAVELEQCVAAELVTYRYGRIPGYQLTDDGRAVAAKLLAEELTTAGARPVLEAAYDAFRAVNRDLLAVCTDWQLRTIGSETAPNDHTDAAYDDDVRRRLADVHARVEPILDRVGAALPRFLGHQQRLRAALERVRAGDDDYVTRPMFPSYHATWFELHEDLLATLGIDRSTEPPGADAPAPEESQ